MLLRRVNTLSPIEPTMRSRLSAASSACEAAAGVFAARNLGGEPNRIVACCY
jgi:hypothetical protein